MPAEGFLRHRGLIALAVGGAVGQACLLTVLAPAARPLAPQVTAIPPLAVFHDLRWLFGYNRSWAGFALTYAGLVLARGLVSTALIRLAWPRRLPAPAWAAAFGSCLIFTVTASVLLSPVVTLLFGVSLLPFSWPYLAGLAAMLLIAIPLSHGGLLGSWWRTLPSPRAVGWLLASFVVLSVAAAAIGSLATPAALAVCVLVGLVNARAWYGLAGIAARVHPRTPASVPAKVLLGLPFAPIAAIMTLALVVGVARLMFTGTIQLPISTASPVAAANASSGGTARAGTAATGTPATATAAAGAAVLVVSGFGSSCCDAANGLRAKMPGSDVRQFSYVGLDSRDFPVRHGPSADDLPLPVLGDRIAAQLEVLHNQTHRPVDVVAASEGTLGVYAMLSRHPGLPIGSIVLLSPIVDPGRVSYPSGQDAASVSEEALSELNHLAGEISPYGPSGAQQLLSSVSEFGAQYFDTVSDESGKSLRWLAVVPLADALTLPVCTLPPTVIVVPAFHGGLLGDGAVLPMVANFLEGQQVSGTPDMREAAEVITGAAAAWRMPDTRSVCPS